MAPPQLTMQSYLAVAQASLRTSSLSLSENFVVARPSNSLALE